MTGAAVRLSQEEHWALDREKREPPARPARERTEELLVRIADLEDRAYVQGMLLESALELLDRRAAEHARTLELVAAIVRCDEIIAAHDDARPRLAAAA